MDDALSESDNIFSRSPKQDRTASAVGKSWPLSVFVRSNCCAQSPLSRPPYQLRWVCANRSRPHGLLCLLNICTHDTPQHLTTFHLSRCHGKRKRNRNKESGIILIGQFLTTIHFTDVIWTCILIDEIIFPIINMVNISPNMGEQFYGFKV